METQSVFWSDFRSIPSVTYLHSNSVLLFTATKQYSWYDHLDALREQACGLQAHSLPSGYVLHDCPEHGKAMCQTNDILPHCKLCWICKTSLGYSDKGGCEAGSPLQSPQLPSFLHLTPSISSAPCTEWGGWAEELQGQSSGDCNVVVGEDRVHNWEVIWRHPTWWKCQRLCWHCKYIVGPYLCPISRDIPRPKLMLFRCGLNEFMELMRGFGLSPHDIQVLFVTSMSSYGCLVHKHL